MTRVRVEGFTISLDGYGAGATNRLCFVMKVKRRSVNFSKRVHLLLMRQFWPVLIQQRYPIGERVGPKSQRAATGSFTRRRN
jgi:hypothetical protein